MLVSDKLDCRRSTAVGAKRTLGSPPDQKRAPEDTDQIFGLELGKA